MTEWAKLLQELLDARELTPEQAGDPVGPVPANWRTIRRWLKAEGGIGPDKVRDVCRALGYPPLRGLVAVGFLTPEDVGVTGLASPPVTPLHPTARRVNNDLTNEALPAATRQLLNQAVTFARDHWMASHQLGAAPKEPRMRTRDATTPRKKGS